MSTLIRVTVKPISPKELIETTCDIYEGDDLTVQDNGTILYQGDVVTKQAIHREVKGIENSDYTLSLKSSYSSKSPNQSIFLQDGDNERSLTNLFELLVAARHMDTEGEYIVINASDFDPEDTQSLMDAILKGQDRLRMLPSLMDAVGDEESAAQLGELISENPKQTRFFTASINHLRMSQALENFRTMVNQNPVEQTFQDLLEEHYWIFGSQYCELIPKRAITSDKKLDFPLRRTSDEYFEVIEIKRPGVELFRKMRVKEDKEYEYDVYVEKKELVDAIAQVDDYLSEMDAEQYTIYVKSKGKIKVEKARAKVIIGRDGNQDEMRALRRLNGRLNRIEVITYDQLIAMGQRVLDMLDRQELTDENEDSDLPPPDSSIADIPF